MTRCATVAATIALVCGSALVAASPADAASSVSVVRTLSNAARSAHGCAPLALSGKLKKTAQQHASDMAHNEYFSRTSPDGITWGARIKQAGYAHPAGENLAFGQAGAASVVRSWLNSPKQRRTLLDCDVKKIGVGHANLDGGYWVADLGY
jgi:uncharacterized protein YkwD